MSIFRRELSGISATDTQTKSGDAMKRRRRVEITVETSLLVIRHSKHQTPVWCFACSSPVPAVTPEVAAVLVSVTTRAIYRWVEAAQLHLIEAAEQPPLICLNSLRSLTDQGGNNHVAAFITDHCTHD